jgi:predicted urease superfamily metal-dependent hydrolase
MGDPKTIRINDTEDPERLEKFEKALKKAGQNLSEVVRHIADAYIDFVNEHKHGPTFPVRVVIAGGEEEVPRKAKKGKKGGTPNIQ